MAMLMPEPKTQQRRPAAMEQWRARLTTADDGWDVRFAAPVPPSAADAVPSATG
jgi:hypothetical protein